MLIGTLFIMNNILNNDIKNIMSNPYSILEQFEHKGYFRLPYSDNSVAGIINYTPEDGVKLVLIGGLKEDFESLFHQEEVECIWGELENGKLVTLFHCFSSFSMNGGCSFVQERYECSHMLIGANINSYKEQLYNNVYAKFELLPFWCPPSKLTLTISQETISTTLQTSPLFTEIRRVKIDEERELAINASGSMNQHLATNSVRFSQDTILSLDYTTPKSLTQLVQDAEKFCDFLSFASLNLQVCSSIYITEDKEILSVISKPLFLPKKLTEKKKVFCDFLFKYKDIEHLFEPLIKTWFNDKSVTPIVAHLIDSVTSKKVFTENDFLIVIQALDGYHKRFIRTNGSLENRLKEMYSKYQDITIFSDNTFNASSIAHTRNYFSHLYDESTIQDDVVRNGHGLFEMTKTIRKLLICYIMEFVGFSKDEIEQITSHSNNFYLKH